MAYDPTQPIVELWAINEVPESYDEAVYKVVDEYVYDGNTRQKFIRIKEYTNEELDAIKAQEIETNNLAIAKRITDLQLLVIAWTATADQKTELSLLK